MPPNRTRPQKGENLQRITAEESGRQLQDSWVSVVAPPSGRDLLDWKVERVRSAELQKEYLSPNSWLSKTFVFET